MQKLGFVHCAVPPPTGLLCPLPGVDEGPWQGPDSPREPRHSRAPLWGFPTHRTEEELGMGLETLSSTLGPEASRGASVTL